MKKNICFLFLKLIFFKSIFCLEMKNSFSLNGSILGSLKENPLIFLAFTLQMVYTFWPKRNYVLRKNLEVEQAFEMKFPLYFAALKEKGLTECISGDTVRCDKSFFKVVNVEEEHSLLRFLKDSIKISSKEQGAYIKVTPKGISFNSTTAIFIPSNHPQYAQILQGLDEKDFALLDKVKNDLMQHKVEEINPYEVEDKKEKMEDKPVIHCIINLENKKEVEKAIIGRELKLEEEELKNNEVVIQSINDKKHYSQQRIIELENKVSYQERMLSHFEKKYRFIPFLDLIIACSNKGFGMGMIYEKGLLIMKNILFVFLIFRYLFNKLEIKSSYLLLPTGSIFIISLIFLYFCNTRIFESTYQLNI